MKVRLRMPQGSRGGSAGRAQPAAQAFATAAEVLERVLLVPSSLRGFGVDAAGAQRVCGVGPDLLEELLDLGLPSRRIAGERTFDGIDLANVAVHLCLPSLQRHAMANWGRTLQAVSEMPRARYALEYRTRCEHCLPKTSGSYRFLVPPGRYVAARGGASHRLTIERPTRWPQLPPEAEAVAAELDGFWFWGLPAPLKRDMGFIRQNRLTGCGMAARMVLDACRARKLEARSRFGLMLVVPFSGPHLWNEVRVEREWVPYDPFLMQTIARHAEFDASRWPATRSPGAILAPMGTDREQDLAVHNGHPSRASIATQTANGRTRDA